MSYAESSTETFLKFARDPNWISSRESVLAGDLLSMHNESNLLLNPDFYEEKDGRLWHRERGFLKGSAIKASQEEEGIVDQIQEWFSSHGSGIAVQISPRKKPDDDHPGYPEEQITIYRIAYRWPTAEDKKSIIKKILFFTSHQFKANFRNPEALRKSIFTEDDNEESVFEILDWLKKNSQKRVETSIHDLEEGRTQAQYYARQILSGVPLYEVANEMRQTGFLGKNPIGCGGSTNSSGYSNQTSAPEYYSAMSHESTGVCKRCGTTVGVSCGWCKSCWEAFGDKS